MGPEPEINGYLMANAVTWENVVGVAGFEPTASSSRTKRATKLRHTPLTGYESSRSRRGVCTALSSAPLWGLPCPDQASAAYAYPPGAATA